MNKLMQNNKFKMQMFNSRACLNGYSMVSRSSKCLMNKINKLTIINNSQLTLKISQPIINEKIITEEISFFCKIKKNTF